MRCVGEGIRGTLRSGNAQGVLPDAEEPRHMAQQSVLAAGAGEAQGRAEGAELVSIPETFDSDGTINQLNKGEKIWLFLLQL